MIRKRKRPQQPTQPEPCLFSDEEMAAMLPGAKEEAPEQRTEEEETAIPAPQAAAPTPVQEEEKEEKPLTYEEEKEEKPLTYEEERMVHDMISAMQLFDTEYNASKVRLIAMESATLAQGGIHMGQKYELPAIPGRRFDGSQFTAIYYVSFARSFPSMIDRINLPLSFIYERAVKEYEAM